jgi:hypothetical protein
MTSTFWRLTEAGPDNLGLACTNDDLLLGRTSLIERRDGRYVARERPEIERLLKRAYQAQPPIDRLMAGLARVAAALNANDQCLARIAAVHLQMPDLATPAIREALSAEDMLIKYARDEGAGAASWNPALHPRTGTPPNLAGSGRRREHRIAPRQSELRNTILLLTHRTPSSAARSRVIHSQQRTTPPWPHCWRSMQFPDLLTSSMQAESIKMRMARSPTPQV